MSKVALKTLCRPNSVGKYGIPASAEEYSPDKTRYLRITDIDDYGNLLDGDKKSVSSEDIEKYILDDGDIVFARTGNSTGRTYYHEQKNGRLAYAGFLIKYGLDSSKLNRKYIKYYTISEEYRQWVKNLSVGSTRGNINAQTFADLPVILPDRKQQDLLVSILSALDDKIELNRKINAELEQMARTLYDYWFVQFDFPDANGKPYKSSGGQMIYSDRLKREIPAGWKAVKLEDLLNKRTESAEPNSNLKCIDLSVMPSDSLSIDNFSAGDAFNSNMKKMHRNDILFGSIRPYLKKAGLAPFDGLRAGTVHAFYPKKREHLEFCLITMTSERYFDYAINRSGGSTRMPSISSDDLLDYSVPFSEDVYFKYHKALASFTDAISNNIQQSQKLAELRDWLLPMLMNGQVRVL